MKAHHINKLVTVAGIVINSTKVNHKAKKIIAVCKGCQNEKTIEVIFFNFK